ncbi:MAG: dihydroorotase [Sphaerochaetaceae bacterium]
MVDPHVHFRDGLQSSKETISHGSAVGYACGFRAFFDMPNTPEPLTGEKAILERLAMGQAKVHRDVFYGVYGGLTAQEEQIEALVKLHKRLFPRMVGLKMFAGHSTGNMGIVDFEQQRSVYKTLTKSGYKGVLALHCEKEALLRGELWNPQDPASHSLSRPVRAEVASISDQLELVKESGYQGHIHICHLSTKESLSLVLKAKGEGLKISCGLTPHHALLNQNSSSKEGNLLKMNPPLRAEEERDALYNALLRGEIDWVESDHAPHTLEDKREGASGIPGFGGMVLLLRRLEEAGVKKEVLEHLFGARVCEVFNMELKVEVPALEQLELGLSLARQSYPWDPYKQLH